MGVFTITTEKAQAVLEMRNVQEMSYKQIAANLDISISTVCRVCMHPDKYINVEKTLFERRLDWHLNVYPLSEQ